MCVCLSYLFMKIQTYFMQMFLTEGTFSEVQKCVKTSYIGFPLETVNWNIYFVFCKAECKRPDYREKISALHNL